MRVHSSVVSELVVGLHVGALRVKNAFVTLAAAVCPFRDNIAGCFYICRISSLSTIARQSVEHVGAG